MGGERLENVPHCPAVQVQALGHTASMFSQGEAGLIHLHGLGVEFWRTGTLWLEEGKGVLMRGLVLSTPLNALGDPEGELYESLEFPDVIRAHSFHPLEAASLQKHNV